MARHASDYVEPEARGGNWFCVRAWVQILVDQGRRDDAIEETRARSDAGA
ncbi:hypothetical protein [Streptomyces sp. Ag109_G2-15]|nr:hypothetical protein [Streptomyces sp. Ag109_G2-15]